MKVTEHGYNYSAPASNTTHELRITRAVLVYFPLDKLNDFKYEFRWLYRSWLQMMKHEPPMWRTDLIVFIHNDSFIFGNKSNEFFLTALNCSFNNLRSSDFDPPMCTLMAYTPLRKRNLTLHPEDKFKNNGELYR